MLSSLWENEEHRVILRIFVGKLKTGNAIQQTSACALFAGYSHGPCNAIAFLSALSHDIKNPVHLTRKQQSLTDLSIYHLAGKIVPKNG